MTYRGFYFLFFIAFFGHQMAGCYSFQGVTIDCNLLKSFTVYDIPNNAPTEVPGLSQTFAENLRNEIRTKTCLSYTPANGDIEFNGAITRYAVTSIAPQPGETTAFNRLEISIFVEYFNQKQQDDAWESTFTRFVDFPSNQNLISVQDQLISAITEQIIEDIFNRAFTNW